MDIGVIIVTFAVLVVIKSLVMGLFPKSTLSVLKDMTKNKNTLRKVAITEMIAAILILLAAYYFI